VIFRYVILCAALVFAQDELSSQAQQLAMERRFPEAIALWQKALALNPKHFPSLFNLGLTYFNQKRPGEAIEILRRAAAVSPKDFNTHYLLGAAHSQINQTDDAIRAWRSASQLQPANTRLLQLLVVEYGKGRYFVEAVTAARRALDLNSGDANAYFLAIKACQDAGDWETGAKIAERAVAKFPQLPRANFEHAYYLQKRGEIDGSITFLKKAIELDPKYEEPPFFLGDLLVKQGDNAAALPYLDASIACRNDYVPARVLRARTLMNLERWQEAIAELETTIRMDPRHPQPHLMLSQIYFRQGDEARAKVERDLSLKLRRENPTALEAVQGRPFPASAFK
jgi:tetratricopeptide (TPR) repeat protein